MNTDQMIAQLRQQGYKIDKAPDRGPQQHAGFTLRTKYSAKLTKIARSVNPRAKRVQVYTARFIHPQTGKMTEPTLKDEKGRPVTQKDRAAHYARELLNNIQPTNAEPNGVDTTGLMAETIRTWVLRYLDAATNPRYCYSPVRESSATRMRSSLMRLYEPHLNRPLYDLNIVDPGTLSLSISAEIAGRLLADHRKGIAGKMSYHTLEKALRHTKQLTTWLREKVKNLETGALHRPPLPVTDNQHAELAGIYASLKKPTKTFHWMEGDALRDFINASRVYQGGRYFHHILLQAFAGLRVTEALELPWVNLDFAPQTGAPYGHFDPTPPDGGKVRSEERIHLTEPLSNVLQAEKARLIQISEYNPRNRVSNIYVSIATKPFDDITALADITKVRGVGWHDLRRSYTNPAMAASQGYEKLWKFFSRHQATASMADIYTTIPPERIVEVLDKLAPAQLAALKRP